MQRIALTNCIERNEATLGDRTRTISDAGGSRTSRVCRGRDERKSTVRSLARYHVREELVGETHTTSGPGDAVVSMRPEISVEIPCMPMLKPQS